MAVGAFLGVTGCASLDDAPTPDLVLSETDRDKARALALFAQGLIYEWQDEPDLEGALEAYRSALELDPAERTLRPLAARMLLELSRAEEAMELLRKAVLDFPDSLRDRMSLAQLALYQENFELAALEFATAYELAAEEPEMRLEALRMMAYSRFRLENDAGALEALELLAELGSVSDIDYRENARDLAVELAELSFESSNRVSAAAVFGEFAGSLATEANEKADIWERLGIAALRKNVKDKAAEGFFKAAAADPLRTRAYVTAVSLEEGLDSSAVDINYLLKRYNREPREPAAGFSLARLLMAQGRSEEAMVFADETIDAWRAQNPGAKPTAECWLFQGSVKERAGRVQEAENTFRAALRDYPDNAPILNYLAYMLAEKGRKLSEARMLVSKALEKEPDNSAYLDTMGWVFYKLGKYEEALVWLMRAVEDERRDPVVLDHVGDALQRLGREPEAVTYWKMSLHLDPEQKEVREKLRKAGAQVAPATK